MGSKQTDPMTWVLLLVGAGTVLYFLNKKAKQSAAATTPAATALPAPAE